MEKRKRIAARVCMFAIITLLGIGKMVAQEDYNKAQNAPQQKETVLSRGMRTVGGHETMSAAYKSALREAQQRYPGKSVGIRNLTKGEVKINGDGSVSNFYNYTIVELPSAAMQSVYQAIDRATMNIAFGNRFAIDALCINYAHSINVALAKSEIIDYLIAKGYKVVAKEQLQKMYKEQQDQQSGIYNENTTVKTNNFSAVGYFISINLAYSYVQVQVVNVSTGEYEGNVTLNF